MKITIVGGGIGGCVAALLLNEAGHDVEVYESVVTPTELGVGINVLPHSVRVLDDLGLLPELDRAAVRTSELRLLSLNGVTIWREARGLAAENPWPQYSIHRGHFHRILLGAVIDRLGADRVHTGHRALSVDGTGDDASTSSVTFLDRKGDEHVVVEADITVACDGIHSAIRSQLYPAQGHPHPSGLVLWRGAVLAEPFLDGSTMFMAGDDDQKAVVYPVTPPDSGGRQLINWVAERPMDVDMRTVSWNREVDVAMVAALFEKWALGFIHVGELISSTDTAYEFPMVDRTPVDRWSFGRVTLLGDAAHAMRPNGSNGSSQAILDGEALAGALRRIDDPTEALVAYELERLEPTTRLTLANRQSGPERVMQWVADRCDGSCVDQHVCVDASELEREATAYKELAGFDIARLRAMSN